MRAQSWLQSPEARTGVFLSSSTGGCNYSDRVGGAMLLCGPGMGDVGACVRIWQIGEMDGQMLTRFGRNGNSPK